MFEWIISIAEVRFGLGFRLRDSKPYGYMVLFKTVSFTWRSVLATKICPKMGTVAIRNLCPSPTPAIEIIHQKQVDPFHLRRQ